MDLACLLGDDPQYVLVPLHTHLCLVEIWNGRCSSCTDPACLLDGVPVALVVPYRTCPLQREISNRRCFFWSDLSCPFGGLAASAAPAPRMALADDAEDQNVQSGQASPSVAISSDA
mmetsp:Transcript_17996/g.38833  ORF Transcript_17996/g.38833 Transcript_17996/m.38833 type:complete len:117 (+) Transcript_17996:1019-1369(+)